MKSQKNMISITLGALFIVLSPLALSGEIIYQPNNPSFGGDPLRGNYLLNKAQSQDTHKDPDAPEFSEFTEDSFLIEELRSGALNEALQQAYNGDGKGITELDSPTLDITLNNTGPRSFYLTIRDKTTGEVTRIDFGQ